jgi:hypothetical protein
VAVSIGDLWILNLLMICRSGRTVLWLSKRVIIPSKDSIKIRPLESTLTYSPSASNFP